MMLSHNSSSSLIFNTLLGTIKSRKLLVQPIIRLPPAPGSGNTTALSGVGNGHQSYAGKGSFDANVAMILAVLLCALICALGMNALVRCALHCSRRLQFELRQGRAVRAANIGLTKKALSDFPIVLHSPSSELASFEPLCAICLSEFSSGDRVRLLPKCNHVFHVKCIDKWLVSRSSCPICRHCLLNIKKKPGSCNQANQIELLQPLEPERMIMNYTGIY